MIQCQQCGATITIGATDCAACGALTKPETQAPVSVETVDPTLGRIANLYEGNYGLLKTYWLYGVLGGIVMGLVLGFTMGVAQSLVVTLLALAGLWAYQILVSIAIWNAARKYLGSKLWSVLARVGAVIGLLQLVRTTAQVLGIG
jgi:hypothetical protein